MVPLEHRELRMVGRTTLPIAENVSELPNPRQPGDEQLFHREFGRGMEVALEDATVPRVMELGREGLEMRLEPWAHLQCRRVYFDKPVLGEEASNPPQDAHSLLEPAAPGGEAIGPPPFLHHHALVLAGPPPYVRFCVTVPSPRSCQ